MTKIALILWAMDFMYGMGFTLLAVGIVAVVLGAVFTALWGAATHEYQSYGDDSDKQDAQRFKVFGIRAAIVAITCFLVVFAIPSKCTCYAFMAGEVAKMPVVKELTSDARQIIEDVKVMIHKQAER